VSRKKRREKDSFEWLKSAPIEDVRDSFEHCVEAAIRSGKIDRRGKDDLLVMGLLSRYLKTLPNDLVI